MATYVLVHGAFHRSWCWSRLIPLLEAAGHVAHGPSLTGLGDRASLLSPQVGLGTHVEDIAGLIREKDLRDAIPLGYSYGSMVITGVADQVPDRIEHLVYLDTFVPRTGESMVNVGALVIARFPRTHIWCTGGGPLVLLPACPHGPVPGQNQARSK